MQRFDHRECLAADVHGALEVVWRQSVEFADHDVPRGVPLRHHRDAVHVRPRFELCVPVAVRLLAVVGQEPGEPRPQVASDVVHHDRDAVPVRVERCRQPRVTDLSDGPFGHRPVVPIGAPDVCQTGAVHRHQRYWLIGIMMCAPGVPASISHGTPWPLIATSRWLPSDTPTDSGVAPGTERIHSNWMRSFLP